jgi:hypothetical protein
VLDLPFCYCVFGVSYQGELKYTTNFGGRDGGGGGGALKKHLKNFEQRKKKNK